MSKTALVILAEGSEEIEVVISADALRRAGIEVTIAGLDGIIPTKCSQNTVIVPDISIGDATKNSYDVVILPGGLKGSKKLAQSDAVKQILQSHEKSGRLIAAICAAPTALKSHSIGIGKAITSHSSKRSELSVVDAIKLYASDSSDIEDEDCCDCALQLEEG